VQPAFSWLVKVRGDTKGFKPERRWTVPTTRVLARLCRGASFGAPALWVVLVVHPVAASKRLRLRNVHMALRHHVSTLPSGPVLQGAAVMAGIVAALAVAAFVLLLLTFICCRATVA
jgi:hypothetical protein